MSNLRIVESLVTLLTLLNAQAMTALQDADLRRRLEEAGFSIIGTSQVAAKRMIAAETVK